MNTKRFALLSCICLCSYVAGLPATGSMQAITVKNCGTSILPASSPDRIIGGNFALHGQYPWMVSLQYDDSHICGAAVLNENWVITAAHCTYYNYKPWMYKVLVGLHNRSQEYAPTVQRIKISKILVHADFKKTSSGKDIALLKTAEPIDIAGSKGYVNGICLPNTQKDPEGYATVIGWGLTTEYGEKSDTLKEVVLPIINRGICQEAYDKHPFDKFNILSTMLCAGTKGKDSCQSDSGGPLFQTNSKGESTLIGIVSFGVLCARQFPGVYTKVSSYQNWIENIMAKY